MSEQTLRMRDLQDCDDAATHFFHHGQDFVVLYGFLNCGRFLVMSRTQPNIFLYDFFFTMGINNHSIELLHHVVFVQPRFGTSDNSTQSIGLHFY